MAPLGGYTHDGAFNTGDLQVSDLHRLRYAQHGNPNGKPVIFLHGGPGGVGCKTSNAKYFDPAVYHVVLFDQRGAGASEPSAELRENTTQLLVQDIETLRKHVGVKKWHVVFGGSWGSTLTLAYAQTHPEACSSLILRGVWLGDSNETAELDSGNLWPEEFERYISFLPEDKRSDPVKGYHELIMSGDKSTAFKAAQEWNRWGSSVSSLRQAPAAEIDAELENERSVMSHASLESYYAFNNCFLGPDELLKGCEKIKHIPTSIVQGRYDLICPPTIAWKVHKALPDSKLYWSDIAGHSASEPGTLQKLTEVCDEYGQADF